MIRNPWKRLLKKVGNCIDCYLDDNTVDNKHSVPGVYHEEDKPLYCPKHPPVEQLPARALQEVPMQLVQGIFINEATGEAKTAKGTLLPSRYKRKKNGSFAVLGGDQGARLVVKFVAGSDELSFRRSTADERFLEHLRDTWTDEQIESLFTAKMP